jgi:hypothetical protein
MGPSRFVQILSKKKVDTPLLFVISYAQVVQTTQGQTLTHPEQGVLTMKTILTATALTFTLGLSGLAHAEFKNKGPIIETNPARMTAQDLSHLPSVAGFQDQSHHAEAAVNPSASAGHTPMVLGANCDLNPASGFQNSQSVATC